MSTPRTLYLVDGSGYIFRAFYGIRSLSSRDGTPTNAVVGFARMVVKLLREEQPELLAVVFDTQKKNFRHEIFADYKANREAPPEDLTTQIPLIHELVEALELPCLMVDGYEADDVIATLAVKARESKLKVRVISGDKDLMQLVDDGCLMYDPMKDRTFDRTAVIDKWGVPPELIADVLALAGDTSDNIPGVPKVGPKSAAKLVTEFGDVEAVIAGVGELSKRKAYERNVMEFAEQARLSKRLVTLAYDVPVELDLETLVYREPSFDRVEPFLRRIDAFTLLRDFGLDADNQRPDIDVPPEAQPPPNEPPTPIEKVGNFSAVDRSAYRTLFDENDVKRYLSRARQQKLLSFDLETTSLDPTRAEIVGFALATVDEPAAYVPTGHHYLGVPKQLSNNDVLSWLRPVLADPEVAIVGQNLKYDMVVLAQYDTELAQPADDSMVAAYVLDPGRLSFSLDTLARELLNHDTIKYADIAGSGKNQKRFDEIPVEIASEYAAEDADVALRLATVLPQQIASLGMQSLYRELELPLVPVLAAMETHGVLIDTDQLGVIAGEFTQRIREVEETAQAMTGEPINLGSPKQVGQLLFEKLELPVVKKTKTGYSTDQEVLETLAREHELPKVILEHRMLTKLKSTYVDALPRMVNPKTGRVHTSFNQTGTATGRLSSSDPNLQNIPIRNQEGRRIRDCFIAAPEHVLVAADYSQIELRIMAHLSGDEDFIDAFQRGEDIHTRTAREILTANTEPSSEDRRRAKAINFGILYGLSEYGLSRQLSIPRREAADYIRAYFARYPKIRYFLDRTIDDAKQRGFVTTLSGRRRYLPDLKSRNRNTRMGAERIAMNTPMQGSAADLIKMAMLRVHRQLCAENLRARLILQVHDELVVEAHRDDRTRVEAMVTESMSSVMELAVPLDVDVGHGENWSSAH